VYAKDHSETSGELRRAENNREAFARSDVFAPSLRVPEVFPSTRHEHDPNHNAQKKKRDISEMGQLWKHHALIIQPL
jgi:hypothetical protein